MERRENFALQVALIIFTFAVCVLGVTTYIYFDKFTQQRDERERLATKVIELEVRQAEFQDEIERQRRLLTTNEHATVAELETEHAAHAKEIAPNNAVRPTYQRLIGYLATSVRDSTAQQARLRLQLLDAQELLTREQRIHQAQLGEFKSATEGIQGELDTERAEYRAERARWAEHADHLALVIRRKAAEITAGKIELETVQAELGEQIAKLERQYDAMRNQWEENQPKIVSEHPDGEVVAADAGARMVHINLGSADMLRRGTVFQVFDESAADIGRAKPKAVVEVTKIIGQHQAAARIVQDKLSDPILTHDVVYSPLWQPGRKRRFAIAGEIDLDNDGRDDREKLQALILANGGQIDCEVDHAGRRTGDLAVETRYLVIGNRPTEIDRSRGDKAAYDALLAQAKQLGIDFISVERVVDMAGPENSKLVRANTQPRREFQRRQRPSEASAY